MDTIWCLVRYHFLFVKQKMTNEMRISDWSSDVCSSDLLTGLAVIASIIAVSVQERGVRAQFTPVQMYPGLETKLDQISQVSYTLARGMRAPETVTLPRGPDRKWLVGERHNYPARQDFVQKDLIGVRSAERRVGSAWGSTGRYRCSPNRDITPNTTSSD